MAAPALPQPFAPPPSTERAARLGRPHGPRHAEFTRGLTCSDVGRFSGPVQTLVSGVMHAAIIWAAVVATQGAAEQVIERVMQQDLVFLEPLKDIAKPEPPPPDLAEANVVISTNPPPKGFQTIDLVRDIPTTIPPVDLSQRALDPRDFSGAGVEGGIAKGVLGGTGPVDMDANDIGTVVYRTEQLDEPARVLSQPAPVYPAALQSAGMEGSVIMRFVIDTLGRVELASLEPRSQAHGLFVASARDVLLKSRFSPARLGDRRVRQLTEQRVSFRLSGR